MEVATRFTGEVTVALLPGLEMMSGKAVLGAGGGSWAGGAGRELVVGDHVGGVGFPGGGGGGGAGGGVGEGAGPAVMVEVVPPHPASNRPATRTEITKRTRRVQGHERNDFTAMLQIPERRVRIELLDTSALRVAVHVGE